MHCPKCGYISFDHLESCKKCHKSFSNYDIGLNGTVNDAEPPFFIDALITSVEVESEFDVDETGSDTSLGAEDQDAMIDLDEIGGESLALEDEPITDLEELSVLDDEDDDEPVMLEDLEEPIDDEPELLDDLEEVGDNVILSLDDLEASNDEESVSLEDLEQVDENTMVMPESALDQDDDEPLGGVNLDFGELDISDLKPPEDTPLNSAFSEEGAIDDEKAENKGLFSSDMEGGGLEDLSLEELNLDDLDDLDGLDDLGNLNLAGDEIVEPLETGTALDDFNIDLGELFPEEMEEQKKS